MCYFLFVGKARFISYSGWAGRGRDIETGKACRYTGQAGGWSGRIARQRLECSSLLPLSNARPQPKRQQAARSRDLRNIRP